MVILHIESRPSLCEALQQALHGIDADLYQSPGVSEALASLEDLQQLDVLLVGGEFIDSMDTLRVAAPLDSHQRVAVLLANQGAVKTTPIPSGCVPLALDQPEQLRQFIEAGLPPDLPNSSLVNTQLGDYTLIEGIGLTDTTEIYRAHQRSVDREVRLEMLKPEYLADQDVVREFRATVRAKAALVHPHVVPVYEAMETDGALYYTTEHVQGMPLPYFVETGQTLSEKNLVQLVLTVAETMSYLHRAGVGHRPLQAGDIFLDQSRQPHINNLAEADGEMPDQTAEIGSFAATVRPLASRGRVLSLIQRMGSELKTWDEVLDRTSSYQDELRNFSAYQRTETEGLVVAPLERRRRRRRFIIAGLIAALAVGIILLPRGPRAPQAKDFSQMLRVRPGDFIYQDGETLNLSGFWISEYEVTIAQYAAFLQDIESTPGSFGHVAHPSQPPSKTSYRPPEWDELHSAARQGGFFHGQRIDLNCPIILVDWWDAHAYASWRGHRLPTEEEWEKAGRGENGNLFPWGNDPRPNLANMAANGASFSPEGYGYWTPVDFFFRDATPAGIKGMAGNVEEWTESLVQHPDYPDRQVPIVRGGSFATPPDHDLTRRRISESFEETSIARGFRTVSDSAPGE